LALEAALELEGWVSVLVGEYVWRLFSLRRFREAEVLLKLMLELDAITDDWAQADLDFEAAYALATGDIPRAENALRKWEEIGPVSEPGAGGLSAFIRQKCALRALSGRMADAGWIANEKLLSGASERFALRMFRSSWAKWLFRERRWPEAQAKFAEAVAMAREVGIFEVTDECRLAACSARLGEPDQAKDLLARPDGELSALLRAELLLSLGDKESAQTHALSAYREVWGEGFPYVDYLDLLDCRNVFEELGVPEPQLPPFNPEKAQPVRFEAELRAYIDKVKQQKAEDEAANQSSDEAKS
jgi:tetratricopeptide (TPR) repeat protein